MTLVLDADLRPEEAAAALRNAGASRVVLTIHGRPAGAELLAALRRAGAEPFGIETVAVDGRRQEESAVLVAAACAKLDALPPDERGRPRINAGAVSRRSLFSPGGMLTQAPVAVLDESACVGVARCGLCVERCPEDAIATSSPRPWIDPRACTACGLCVPSCPTGALRLAGAATAQTEAQLDELVKGVAGIVLACRAAAATAPPGWGLVELPTLALVTPGWILQLRARGMDVRTQPCHDARCAAGAEAADSFAQVVAGDVAGQTGRVHLTEPQATAEVVRRLGRAGVLESDASPLDLVMLDAARCTLCGACATACPTDALRFDESPEETTIALTPGSCVACGRCASACPEDAVAVRPGLDFARLRRDSVELAWAPRETCSACGRLLPPRPMRRRLREMLPELADAPLGLCATCARRPTAAAQDY